MPRVRLYERPGRKFSPVIFSSVAEKKCIAPGELSSSRTDFRRSPADAAWPGVVVEASLCLLHDVLALPARNPPLVPGCAAGFDRISGGLLTAVVPTHGVQESSKVSFRLEGSRKPTG